MIREITILSGKGGTGKTSVTAALAAVSTGAVFCDCDVDAADLHLLLNPEVKESHHFSSGLKAVIDPDQCISCGICKDACRFSAIRQPGKELYVVDPYRCEGCRLCERLCPADSIHSVEKMNNKWYVSETRFGPMVHAHMGPGEENSGKLVTTVRNTAKEIAKTQHANFILNDGPPGIGCPVIASLTGVSKVLLVVEPSKTGIHDIKRLVELIRKFEIPGYAIINKQDINPRMTALAEQMLKDHNIPLLGKLDFDERFTEAMVHGQTIIEYAPASPMAQTVILIYKKLLEES